MMIFRKFGLTLAQTVNSPSFYVALPAQPKKLAFRFFFKVALLLTALLVIGAFGGIVALINFERNAPQYMSDLGNNFPAGLVVTIKGGHATSNQVEPYRIPTPTDANKDPQFTNLVVLDTKTPFSSRQLAEYDTYAWLGSDTLYYYGRYDQINGKTTASDVRALPLANVPDTVIDRAYIDGWLKKLEPWARGLAPVFALLVVGLMYVAVLFKLVYLLVLALLVWPLSHILRHGLKYGQAYVTGLYAASVPFIISSLADLIHHPLPNFGVTVLALVVVTVNLVRQPRRV